MLYILAAVDWAIVSGIKIALAALALLCTAFIVFVVMKQSGNSDGVEARLKLLTYIAAGILAVACIVLVVLQTFLP